MKPNSGEYLWGPLLRLPVFSVYFFLNCTLAQSVVFETSTTTITRVFETTGPTMMVTEFYESCPCPGSTSAAGLCTPVTCPTSTILPSSLPLELSFGVTLNINPPSGDETYFLGGRGADGRVVVSDEPIVLILDDENQLTEPNKPLSHLYLDFERGVTYRRDLESRQAGAIDFFPVYYGEAPMGSRVAMEDFFVTDTDDIHLAYQNNTNPDQVTYTIFVFSICKPNGALDNQIYLHDADSADWDDCYRAKASRIPYSDLASASISITLTSTRTGGSSSRTGGRTRSRTDGRGSSTRTTGAANTTGGSTGISGNGNNEGTSGVATAGGTVTVTNGGAGGGETGDAGGTITPPPTTGPISPTATNGADVPIENPVDDPDAGANVVYTNAIGHREVTTTTGADGTATKLVIRPYPSSLRVRFGDNTPDERSLSGLAPRQASGLSLDNFISLSTDGSSAIHLISGPLEPKVIRYFELDHLNRLRMPIGDPIDENGQWGGSAGDLDAPLYAYRKNSGNFPELRFGTLETMAAEGGLILTFELTGEFDLTLQPGDNVKEGEGLWVCGADNFVLGITVEGESAFCDYSNPPEIRMWGNQIVETATDPVYIEVAASTTSFVGLGQGLTATYYPSVLPKVTETVTIGLPDPDALFVSTVGLETIFPTATVTKAIRQETVTDITTIWTRTDPAETTTHCVAHAPTVTVEIIRGVPIGGLFVWFTQDQLPIVVLNSEPPIPGEWSDPADVGPAYTSLVQLFDAITVYLPDPTLTTNKAIALWRKGLRDTDLVIPEPLWLYANTATGAVGFYPLDKQPSGFIMGEWKVYQTDVKEEAKAPDYEVLRVWFDDDPASSTFALADTAIYNCLSSADKRTKPFPFIFKSSTDPSVASCGASWMDPVKVVDTDSYDNLSYMSPWSVLLARKERG